MTYNPQTDSAFAINKPIATIGTALDRRTQLPVVEDFLSRDFISVTEAIAYYSTSFSRGGGFSVFINSTGVLQPDGSILGGVREEYWWKDGTQDSNLVLKVTAGADVAPEFSDNVFNI